MKRNRFFEYDMAYPNYGHNFFVECNQVSDQSGSKRFLRSGIKSLLIVGT